MRYNDALKLFELDDTATDSQIRKKYLQLSRLHHPDKGGNDEKFKELQEAYSVLTNKSDPDADPAPNPADTFFHGIFGGFSEQFAKFRGTQHTPRLTVKRTRLTVKELFRGATREIRVHSSTDCTECDGTGTQSRVKCADCDGTGVKSTRQHIPMGARIIRTTCSTCSGRGAIGMGSDRICTACKGHREIHSEHVKEARIPKAIPANTKIVINEGTVLQVQHPYANDPDWGDWELTKSRQLHTKQTISLETALLGGILTLKHPGLNDTLTIQIPAGVQPNSVLTIKDKGLPACPEAKLPPTNIQITFNVSLPNIPEKHIENTRRFLSALQK